MLRLVGGAILGALPLAARRAWAQVAVQPAPARLGPAAPTLQVSLALPLRRFGFWPTTVYPPGMHRLNLGVSVKGSGNHLVSWGISTRRSRIRSGQQMTAAGQSFSVTQDYEFQAGTHEIEGVAVLTYLGKPVKSATLLRVRVHPIADWAARMSRAVAFAVNTWKFQAYLDNVVVNGATAIGTPGCLKGPKLDALMKGAPDAFSVPVNVRNAFANAVSTVWAEWQDQVIVPGLPWYPSFVAYPGPTAPPTPNIPMPLITLASGKLSSVTTPDRLKILLLNELGKDEAVSELIDLFAKDFAQRALIWLPTAHVAGAMGTGPVPSFAPPVVAVGRVANGRVLPTPGILKSAPAF